LFGYIKGAFTDAKRDKPGRFELARGGSIFLDEVESLSLAMQVKMLRVLQEKEFEPLGATAPVKADVRVIAASKEDLSALVEKGMFRDDL
jgi:transcriptional regulator with PAS, ATPase and Fis domain